MTRRPITRLTGMVTVYALVAALSVPPDSVPTDSVRPAAEIRMAALRHVADIRRCYEREGLTRDPRLSGSIEVTVTVLPTGAVREAAVSALEMRGLGVSEVAECLTTAMRNWRFARGPFAVEHLVFPFRFSPDAQPTRRVASRG